MKRILFALVVSMLTGCAAQHAYSGDMGPARSPESNSSPSSDAASGGAAGAEPDQATFSRDHVFSTDDLENQRHAFEAWEAGG
jgi:hypothetical protein